MEIKDDDVTCVLLKYDLVFNFSIFHQIFRVCTIPSTCQKRMPKGGWKVEEKEKSYWESPFPLSFVGPNLPLICTFARKRADGHERNFGHQRPQRLVLSSILAGGTTQFTERSKKWLSSNGAIFEYSLLSFCQLKHCEKLVTEQSPFDTTLSLFWQENLVIVQLWHRFYYLIQNLIPIVFNVISDHTV